MTEKCSIHALIVSFAIAATLSAPGIASACGGFFCNNNTPTVQTGERILFTVEEESIRAYVQVYYDGPADDFAWVVPVATVPEVGVGTDEVFTRLDQLTSPIFKVNYEVDEACFPNDGFQVSPNSADAFAENATAADDGAVTVLAQGKTGPYNYQVVNSNDADVLVAWLNENGYEQPPQALPLIEHYVAKEMKFVAVKLLPNKDAGDIAPIILDFEEQGPCIPLILTSIAAQEDMPVKAYVLGEKRAVPTNWLHVDINLKKLDWFAMDNASWNPGLVNLDSNYENLLIQAIEEAEGHAFTTEYAGTSSIMENQLDFGQYDNVEDLLSYEDPAEFVFALQLYFSGSNQLLNLLQQYIPSPDNIDDQSFYNCPACHKDAYDALEVDLDALYAELFEVIVKPVQEAQEMFDRFPYLTRLYSRVSLNAMDRDPLFAFEDAGDVSNLHTATFYMKCSSGNRNYYMELENGETFVPINPPTKYDVNTGSNQYSNSQDIEAMPAAESIELYVPGEGAKAVGPDDVAYVEEQLRTQAPENVDVPAFIPDNKLASVVFDSGGCSTHKDATTPWMTLLFLVGLSLLRRKTCEEG